MDHRVTISTDGAHCIPLYNWEVDNPVAVVHISHGLSEHALRYEDTARLLNQAGFVVYAHDHRGHGQALTKTIPGHFSNKRGWGKVVDDMDHVVQHIRSNHPGLPLFLLGHSMGSYVLLNYLMTFKPDISGLILSGSNFAPRPLLHLGQFIASLEESRTGKRGNSRLLQKLTFGQYNRAFRPNRTEFDWLSRDQGLVDNYIEDPLCGHSCTSRLWCDLFKGLLKVSTIEGLSKINPGLPALVFGGLKDPVSTPPLPGMMNGQQKLAQALQKAGVESVTLRLYPDARHETLNEINRKQVVTELVEWLESHIQKPDLKSHA